MYKKEFSEYRYRHHILHKYQVNLVSSSNVKYRLIKLEENVGECLSELGLFRFNGKGVIREIKR